MLMWGIVGVFLVLSILLLSGRGAFLIAGYNTASAARRSRYDEKKLGRVIGGGMLLITLLLGLLAAYGNAVPGWLLRAVPVVVVADALVMLVLCNTVCKASTDPQALQEQKTQADPNARKWRPAFVAVVLALVGILLLTGSITTTLTADTLAVKATYWPGTTLQLARVESVELTEEFSVGSRTNGLGSPRLQAGYFRSGTLGDYLLYSYTGCHTYIIITPEDGYTLVLNAADANATKALAEEIKTGVAAAKMAG